MLAPAPPPPSVVAPAARGEVHAFGGWMAWLRPHAAHGRHRLVVMSPGGARRVVPIAPRARTADFDLGSDGKGRVALVLSRCGSGPGSCDLSLVSLTTGREQRIANASARGLDERTPTLWRGRVAWTRYATSR